MDEQREKELLEEIESLRSENQKLADKYNDDIYDAEWKLKQAEQERDFVKEELESIRPMVDLNLHDVKEANIAMREIVESVSKGSLTFYLQQKASRILSRYPKEGETK